MHKVPIPGTFATISLLESAVVLETGKEHFFYFCFSLVILVVHRLSVLYAHVGPFNM